MPKKHSVLLKESECERCTNCVTNCPTKAIRVHQGKATIREDLCIDCAECIRTCEYHAKYTQTDTLADIEAYEYPVALVPPSFYGQFADDIAPVQVVAALHEIGFKAVEDVAMAAEAISKKTLKFLNNQQGSYISSSCPVVVRLIKLLYPELLDYLIPFKSPVELMAEKVREDLTNNNNISQNDLGIFLLTPCPAKLTTVNNPLGIKESFLDGAIAVDIVYEQLIDQLNSKNHRQKSAKTYDPPYLGISWGQSGGETDILNQFQEYKTLSVDGIAEVKHVLDEISRDNIQGVKYFELVACPEGCVGGVLNVNNPYQAKYNIKKLKQEQKQDFKPQNYDDYNYNLDYKFEVKEVGHLDKDINKAVEKLTQLEKEKEILPGLDCASCGAPDCETLAEDIVNGKAKRTDCIFMLRKEIEDMAERISNLTHELPPVMSEDEGDNDDESKRGH